MTQTRTLRMINQINRLIVRTGERNELFEKACRIAVEEGGFLMAWVGEVRRTAGDDSQPKVVPVAWHGRRGEYLEHLRILPQDAERGAGPTGTALRRGAHVVCNDIAADPRMAPWRKAALELGFRSSAAFPLFISGSVVGTFNLYAGTENAFQDEELIVLDELAGDLSCALQYAEEEAARRNAEAALSRERELMQRMMEAMPVGMVRLGADGIITYANAAAEEVLGLSRDYISTRRYNAPEWRITAPNGDPMDEADLPFSRIMGGERIVRGVRHRIAWPDGTSRLLEVNATALLGEEGRQEGMVASVEDVTEHTKLYQRLMKAQKMESVGRLAGGVAHDFNNMLQVVLGYASLALGSLPDDSPVRRHIDQIKQAASRSAELTHRLLAFAQKQHATPRQVDVNETVGALLDMFRRVLGEGIELRFTPGSGLALVYIDPAQIEQILANLVVNARDAISPPGTVEIATRERVVDAETGADVDAAPGIYVEISVADTGVGMSEETRSRLFEPFYTTKSIGEGTGLGLASVLGILQQNGGFIEVSSSPGNGSVFRAGIPRTERARVPVGAQSGAEESSATRASAT
ncbi:MAG: GAF domain-containing protein [Spirochaetaceae bacterium]